MQVDTDRFTHHTRTIFNDEWEKMPFRILYENPNYTPARPKNFTSMLQIAKLLSKPFGGVRIDLYSIDKSKNNKGVFIGEITFTPEGGSGGFYPDEWDKKFGELWH